MIRQGTGDLLDADVEAIVNTVNCVGAMGKGLALQFKKAYPANNSAYRKACENGSLRPGTMLIVPLIRPGNPKYIVNFPTKDHWKDPSRMRYIESGLKALVLEVKKLDIKSIAIPQLGCGLGRLHWSDVRPRIIEAFEELPDVDVVVYGALA